MVTPRARIHTACKKKPPLQPDGSSGPKPAAKLVFVPLKEPAHGAALTCQQARPKILASG